MSSASILGHQMDDRSEKENCFSFHGFGFYRLGGKGVIILSGVVVVGFWVVRKTHLCKIIGGSKKAHFFF